MELDRELTYSVYISDYLVAEESVPDVVEYLDNDTCPMCKGECGTGGTPAAGGSSTFVCPDCGIEIITEAWLVE